MIEKLTWDSEFFGYTVGRIDLSGNVSRETINDIKNSNKFKLVYVFSENTLPPEFDSLLYDTKIVFEKSLSIKNGDVEIITFEQGFDSYQELLDLAILSGTYSRYKVDKNFRNNEFERLYKKWIDKSLTQEKMQVLVTKSNKILTGFVTVELSNEVTARIGLISVNENFQGKGYGSSLIKMAENVCLESGRSIIQVVTQFDNKPAVKLYEKNGYKIISSIFVYHLWNT